MRLSHALAPSAACVFAFVAAAVVSAQDVTTYHNDNFRTGLNPNESILNPSNVNSSTFGLLFSLPVDGQVYAQPLYLSNVSIPGKGVHNVLYVATQHNTVYAFDADSNQGANAQPLWKVNLGPSMPSTDSYTDDITPEVGITGTPVIAKGMPGGPWLYVVAKTKTTDPKTGAVNYAVKLHALNCATGAQPVGSPNPITRTIAGTGEGSVSGSLAFQPRIQHQRAALNFVPASATNGNKNLIVITFASHGDNGPYHGWVFAYDATTLRIVAVYNTTPNAKNDPSGYPIAAGGIWQGGYGPATDGESLFFATGNGKFDPATKAYGDAVVRLKLNTFGVGDYFAPYNQQQLDDTDADLGSGGVMLLPSSAQGTSNYPLMVQSGKEGTLYLMRRDNLGGYHATNTIVQELTHTIGGVWGGPAYFNNTIYYGGSWDAISAFPIANGQFYGTGPSQRTGAYFGYPGTLPSISSSGNTNGIVWALRNDGYNLNAPAELHAFDASDITRELYNSAATAGRDDFGFPTKFSTPTISNGKVYCGGNNQVGVFGLGTWTDKPTISVAAGTYQNPVQVSLTDTDPTAVIHYTVDGTVPTIDSPTYGGPITISTATVLKARAYSPTKLPSAIASADYLINPVIGTGNGLAGYFYNGIQDPAGTATARRRAPVINFSWNGASPITGVDGTNWAGMWTGKIQAESTGLYRFTTNSDDGVRVWINNVLVIDNYTYHGPTLDSGTIALTAGVKVPIVIKYFQGSGTSVLQMYWSATGIPQQIVPSTQLYPN